LTEKQQPQENVQNFLQNTSYLQLLDLIIKDLPGIIFWKDKDSVYMGCNNTLLNVFNVSSTDEIIGKTDKDFQWPHHEAERVIRDDLEVMSSRKAKYNIEESLPLPNGKIMFCLTSKVPLINHKNEVFGLLGTATDITHIKKLQTDLEKAKQLAEQAAHDIRSPLAAFNILLQQLEQFPEHQRCLLRNATQRINDIANNLLSASQHQALDQQPGLRIEPAYGLLDSILSEKRVQFTQRHLIFNLNVNNDACTAFINVNPIELKRVLSNLINNAAEAIEKNQAGIINLSVNIIENSVIIQINDNGKGMSQHVLDKSIESGFSHGKLHGAGLGLTYAVNKIQEWQGEYHISSEENHGTSINISLPLAETEKWFAKEIFISKKATVVVLDDDASIHQVWGNRLTDYTIKHFYQADKFANYMKQHQTNNALYLIDHELFGSEHNGLKLIQEYDLIKQSYLVTSRYEDESIRKACDKIGLKMIPKPYSVHIPIKEPTTMKYDAILIDDDALLRSTWELAASMDEKQLLTFADADSFLQQADTIDKTTTIYIDSQLGNGVKGEQIAKDIYDLGFKTIYLATGHDPDRYPSMPWIKAIVGKEPNW
tara:strand:- start:38166 stop:39959 length:1794 start_codon:yes stop_codon:yes gene_type:complete